MLSNIRILLAACKNLNISYDILHPNQNLVRVKLNKYYHFSNYSTPFNTQSIAQIFKDKEYTYQILKESINLPRSISFLSPFCDEKYQQYLEFQTIPAIVESITASFDLPLILKRNSGSGGNNVFLCRSQPEISTALSTIFNIHSKNYDYCALAQEYIQIKNEYRVIFFNQELLLVYEKNIAAAKFAGNLSPLHWEGAKAKYIDNPQVLSEIENFTQPIFQELEVNYAGLDIAVDQKGTYWLIEINSHPNYDIFIRDNGDQKVLKIFEKLLLSLMEP
jgi:glutathione synthase/RimK-type ligase-like ATP-grasp enzyme